MFAFVVASTKTTIIWVICLYYFSPSCDSMEKLRRKCETLEKEVQDSASFKEFYLFTFNFAKNPGQKSLGKLQLTYH